MSNLVKINRLTRDDHTAKHQARARKDFAQHEIRHRDHRSWTCFRRHKDGGWDSTFWFEAVVLYGGTLLVNGDIDLMHFAYYGKYQDPQEVLRWMGANRDLGYYVHQKACIGMTLSPTAEEHVVTTLDDGVWMDDAIGHIEDRIERKLDTSKEIDLDLLAIPDWLKELVSDASTTSIAEVLAQAGDSIHSDAWETGVFEWGRVPSTRLIYAHEALRRVVQLLDEERKAQEPKVEVANAG